MFKFLYTLDDKMAMIKINKKNVKVKSYKKEILYEFEEDVTNKSDKDIEEMIKKNKFKILEKHLIA